jgi:voltage-gated potassium channel
MNGNNSNHEPVGLFQLIVLILSVVVLGALFADTAFKLPPQISNVLQTVDTLVCVLLLSDFAVRFYRAKSKLTFMKWGWIDLIASIPNIPILRIGRLVRILRVIRLLRAIRATHKITSLIICEQPEPTANIKTAEDAVWWSVATITTVGYGDKYPVTAEGRVLAMMLMVCGAGMFGLVSGLVASSFIGIKKDNGDHQTEIIERLKKLEEKIDDLNHKSSFE